MSRGKQRHSDLSPSLFPFLAVLLCTVGALVLILVMVVGQSQASVKQAIDTQADRAQELRVKVEKVRDSFREEREEIQLEIEKKRMSLQSLEQQTTTLAKELAQLSKTSELVDKELTSDDSVEKVAAAVTDLQKQLQEAAERLKTKLEKPTGEKPVFAIIPYEGSNGTHRRPIYLECRADGIVIQPEGVMIGLKDLKPPYGPGNPLDAALRKVRAYYAPGGAALNSAAYPLLVVRSSGIRTYALARIAMGGWDDQFGYELIEDDMELSFPEAESKLAKELQSTLATARDRQAALVMAMPGKYRKAMEELDDEKFTFGDEPGQWNENGGTGGAVDAPGSPSGGGMDRFGSAGTNPGGESLAGNGTGSGSGRGADGSIAGSRGGFAFAPDGSMNMGSRSMNGTGSPTAGTSTSGSGSRGFATGGDKLASATKSGSTQGGAMSSNSFGTQPGQTKPQGSTGANSFADGASNGNQFTKASGNESGGAAGDPQWNSGEGGGKQSTREDSNTSKSAQSGKTGTGSSGNFRDAMNAARDKQAGTADSSSKSQTSSATDTGNGGTTMVAANSDGFGSMGANGQDMSSEAGTPTANMSMKKNDKKNTEAVAKRRGRGWAWTAGPPRQTAVVRNIRIACYEDRWVVMPDAGSKDKPQTVMLDVSLQTSAEQLAKVVASRMDRWGYALSDGYWKPVLQVEVAARGETRYEQLVRLLEGSGLDVERLKPASPTIK